MSGAVDRQCHLCGKYTLEDPDTGAWKCKRCKGVDMAAHVRGMVQRQAEAVCPACGPNFIGTCPHRPPVDIPGIGLAPDPAQLQQAHDKLLGDPPEEVRKKWEGDVDVNNPRSILEQILEHGSDYFVESNPEFDRYIHENYFDLIAADDDDDVDVDGNIFDVARIDTFIKCRGDEKVILQGDFENDVVVIDKLRSMTEKPPLNPITRITQWQQRQFPTATLESVLKHLDKEVVEELEARAGDDKAAQRKELGDRVFLALAALKKLEEPNDPSTSPEMVIESILADNMQREWLPPDADGCVHHVKKPKFVCEQHPNEEVKGEGGMCWICIKEDDDFRKHRRRTYEAGQIIPFGPGDFGGSDFPEDL